MESEILSKLGFAFMVKGNDVVPINMMSLAKFDPSKELGGTTQQIKELLDKGYELAVDDGSEKSKAMKSIIKNSNVLSNSMFNPSLGSDLNSKILRNIKLLGSGLGKVLPSIAGFSSIPSIPGAIASGLLYAGTSKKGHAPTLDYQLDRPGNILDTPITAANRNLYDQVKVDTSFGLDRDPVVFDRYMQNKIQNLKNNEGIMNAKPSPISNYTAPDRGDWGPGLHLYRGGIASLRR